MLLTILVMHIDYIDVPYNREKYKVVEHYELTYFSSEIYDAESFFVYGKLVKLEDLPGYVPKELGENQNEAGQPNDKKEENKDNKENKDNEESKENKDKKDTELNSIVNQKINVKTLTKVSTNALDSRDKTPNIESSLKNYFENIEPRHVGAGDDDKTNKDRYGNPKRKTLKDQYSKSDSKLIKQSPSIKVLDNFSVKDTELLNYPRNSVSNVINDYKIFDLKPEPKPRQSYIPDSKFKSSSILQLNQKMKNNFVSNIDLSQVGSYKMRARDQRKDSRDDSDISYKGKKSDFNKNFTNNNESISNSEVSYEDEIQYNNPNENENYRQNIIIEDFTASNINIDDFDENEMSQEVVDRNIISQPKKKTLKESLSKVPTAKDQDMIKKTQTKEALRSRSSFFDDDYITKKERETEEIIYNKKNISRNSVRNIQDYESENQLNDTFNSMGSTNMLKDLSANNKNKGQSRFSKSNLLLKLTKHKLFR